MKNLPQIQAHNTLIQAVNARELHAFLQNKRQFADWIKQRISEYDFVENQDFVSFSQNCEKPKGGRPTTEYAITLDMAKELSMVERNEQGELSRIGRILRPYADFRKSTEKTLIKRICLGDHSAVWEAVKEMDNTADGYSLFVDDKAFYALECLAMGASHE